MKYLLRPYRISHIRLGLAAFAAVAASLSLAPQAAHAQAQELMPIFEDSSPLLTHAAAGYLGVDVADVDTDKAQSLKLKEVRGAIITLIDHDAPAGQIGLKVNDVVLAIDGQNVEGAEALRRILREIPPGRKVSLEISREGNIQTLAVQLVDRKEMEHDVWARIGIDADGISPVPPPPGMGIMGGDAPVSSGFHMSLFTGSLNVGAMVEPLTSQMAESLGVQGGLMVKQVARKSEAATAGFKAFDVILKVGNDSIATAADWDRSLRSNLGKPVQVTILRDRKQQTITLQVDSKHRGAVDYDEFFGTGDEALIAETYPLLDPESAQLLAAQADAFRSQLGDLHLLVSPAAAEQLQQQAEKMRESMKNLQLDPQQTEQLRRQMEQMRNNFPNPQQLQQLQQQIEKLRKQMLESQQQSHGNFV